MADLDERRIDLRRNDPHQRERSSESFDGLRGGDEGEEEDLILGDVVVEEDSDGH